MIRTITQDDAEQAGKSVIFFCLLIEITIQILDLLFNYFQLIDSSSLRKIFNVAREQSLGTWFSVIQAAVAGLVLLGLHYLSKLQNTRAWGWLLLALFFLYISADDAAKIHERVGGYIGKAASSGEDNLLSAITSFFPSYNWQWVFAPFFSLMGFYILIFLWQQMPASKPRFMVLAALGCWAVAVGIDFIEGIEGIFEPLAKSLNVKLYAVSHPFLMLEEFLEMFGTTLFLSLFVRQLVINLAKYLKAT